MIGGAPPWGPSRKASCTTSGKTKGGFHPNRGTIYALWLGYSGSVPALPALGTLSAETETMNVLVKLLPVRRLVARFCIPLLGKMRLERNKL